MCPCVLMRVRMSEVAGVRTRGSHQPPLELKLSGVVREGCCEWQACLSRVDAQSLPVETHTLKVCALAQAACGGVSAVIPRGAECALPLLPQSRHIRMCWYS